MTETYDVQLQEEAKTWCIEDPDARHEKYQRERIRHSKLIRDLCLDKLDTHLMDICEVGGGPEPLSDLLQFKSRTVIDPCTPQYRRFFPVPDHVAGQIEHSVQQERFDLVICTNALDHVEDPYEAVGNMDISLRAGGYMAIMCAENNALTNPHPCHYHNLTAEKVHHWLDEDYETVWELTFAQHNYRYGWVKYQGKRGQPAFALLMRKCSGYS